MLVRETLSCMEIAPIGSPCMSGLMYGLGRHAETLPPTYPEKYMIVSRAEQSC